MESYWALLPCFNLVQPLYGQQTLPFPCFQQGHFFGVLGPGRYDTVEESQS